MGRTNDDLVYNFYLNATQYSKYDRSVKSDRKKYKF